ncbi:IucA/IucC family protein [Chondromyces crocatus]|uniref:IucA/IucC family protein n=1 Tax=Chondromyces crocatus TaxID=52 RepID=A0A0K1EBZ4_CHOCO|nr:IucA/IucC family protein [Chondromyces crocatus]AKT38197.1 IucA/IucC family protein [Chondromyces crocatus]
MNEVFDPSVSAFLNALLREWTGWRLVEGDETAALVEGQARRAVEIPLRSHEAVLYVPVRRLSRAGRHRLLSPARLRERDGAVRPVPFQELATLIVQEPDIVGRVTRDEVQRFLPRVLSSAQNIVLNLEARTGDLERIFSAPLDFIEAEQALLTGHSIHPTPKSRDGLSDADARLYAPELAGAFPLRWFAVRKERWVARSVEGAASPDDAVRQLLGAESVPHDADLPVAPEGYALLPAHPWQVTRWASSEPVQRCLAREDLLDLGAQGGSWTATSSLRTVYSAHSPWMLKFSTSLRLTNSLRTLSVAELERGLLLSRVLTTPQGQELARRYPRFHILPEPLYLGLRGDDGSPLEETTVAFRENPFQGTGWSDTTMLATLLQDHPRRGVSRLAHQIGTRARAEGRSPSQAALQWFRAFLDVVLEPMLIARSDYGLLLSAHQQNLILRLRDGMPERVWFRDCQGTAYSDVAVRVFEADAEAIAANTFSGERADYFFSYSVVINAVFNVIASLSIDELTAEQELLAVLRSFLDDLRHRPLRDRGCLDYLLDSPRLWSKGNFFCCLRAINESTIDDPLEIYHQVDNPLRLAHTA